MNAALLTFFRSEKWESKLYVCWSAETGLEDLH